MRLIEVLERQTGYLIFIHFNRVKFLHGSGNYFCLTVSHTYSIYTSMHFSQLFSGQDMPLQNS